MKKESFIIEGLNGAKSLSGTIRIGGAKNAALKAMAAAVLFGKTVELRNIPNTEDVHTMIEILEKLGATVNQMDDIDKNSGLTFNIDTTGITSTVIDSKLGKSMRSSVVLTGPLLARYGTATFSTPGGCVIGSRPIDQFVKGYRVMGAKIEEKDCAYEIIMKSGTNDANVTFEKKTVGGTETLMMASVLGNGTITLNNCAMEPEIVNVAEWLNDCGANIKGAGTEVMMIEGTRGQLLTPTTPYVAIPDRVETGSYLLLGALCAEELTIENCNPTHIDALVQKLTESGVPIAVCSNSKDISKSQIEIRGNNKPNSIFRSFNISTKEYPGFPTDLQAQVVTFLTQTTGKSEVVENIFEDRYKYISDLQKMGGNIRQISAREIHVEGPTPLRSLKDDAELNAHDIRAGFAIVMATLVSKGRSRVNHVYYIDRGYEKLEDRLINLGASVKRVQSQ